MKFTKLNNNPHKNKCGDCVIRAISHALNQEWETTKKELDTLSNKMYMVFNDKEVIIQYLKSKGYEVTTPKVIKGNKRLKVEDFTKGNYILSVAHHLTTTKEGVLYDTFDCREKAVYKYWLIETD